MSKTAWVIVLSVPLLGVPRLAGMAADTLNYSAIDPDGAFAWISVHHIIQALIFLIIMLIITKFTSIRFGFGWGDWRKGIRWVGIFSLFFVSYVVVSIIIVLMAGTFQAFPYPLETRNIVGQLGFQLMLSGPSEELIFRAFAITMLTLLIKGRFRDGPLSHACIIAAIIFSLAHVSFTVTPFSVSYNGFQLLYAFGLGLAYGACYEQTNSVYYPMLMHSISNVVAVGVSVGAGFWLS
ncbi:MAG: CPBP family intramembrane metalloprotease [Saccharospirillum sp.]|nr:CPBP family intramembrane metalloprotease [Saccharospirillum sp.]